MYENKLETILNEPLATGGLRVTDIGNLAFGLVKVFETSRQQFAFLVVVGGAVSIVVPNAFVSLVKDTAGKLNFYFEGGALRIQNKTAYDLHLYVDFDGFGGGA